VLDAIPSPAFVTGARGRLLRANAAGRAWIAEDRRGALARIRAADHRVRLPTAGLAEHHLVVVEPERSSVRSRVAWAAHRWGLTPREREVLARVAAGERTRAIAASLRITSKTVAGLLSSLLEKSGTASRAELVARILGGT
jgi:DNA-binding CsgD family transcriptional regulator